jgi:DNA-binding protein
MHLIYLDEVKFSQPNQPFHWLCGLAIPEEKALELDNKAAEIAKWYFGDAVLKKENEFHAKEIIHGKGPYKGHDISRRIELFKQLLNCFSNDPDVGKIEVRIDPSKIVYERHKPDDCAFMFFAEKADSFMKAKSSIGLLISDDDQEKMSSNVGSLSNYRQYSTDFQMGRKIDKLVDTIHHTKSHYSRLIQLADIYVYTCSLQGKEQDKHAQKTIQQYAKSETEVYSASKYKYWPTADSVWLPKG